MRAPDRDQLRTQITGAKTIRTRASLSKKFMWGRYGEGAAEIARIEQEEVEVGLVDSVPQQIRVEALTDEGWIRHIPDFTNLMSDGRRVLRDAKRDWADFRTPDGVRQTFLGRLAADVLGYDYERYVLAMAGSEQRRENVSEIYAARFTSTPDHVVAIAAATVARGPISLGNLSAILHPVLGRNMAFALMVRRVVEIDLDGRLSDRDECRAVPPLPSGMPSIRQ